MAREHRKKVKVKKENKMKPTIVPKKLHRKWIISPLHPCETGSSQGCEQSTSYLPPEKASKLL